MTFSYYNYVESFNGLYSQLKSRISAFEGFGNGKKVSGIYYIFNDNDELMYIGQSKNIASRITTHLLGKYKHCNKIIIEQVDVCELNDVERFLIDVLKPIDNIMVGEEYNIEKTEWSEKFIDIHGKYNFSGVLDDIKNSPRTKIFPKIGVVLSPDFAHYSQNVVETLMCCEPEIYEKIVESSKCLHNNELCTPN